MQPMITNGGSHPPDKWAEVTTDTILNLIVIAEDADEKRAADARQVKRDLRPVLFDIFHGHHDGVQRGERDHLKGIKKVADAHARLAEPLTLHADVPSALEEVNAALQATPFAKHFAQPHVQEVLQAIIGQHSANVQHIERQWHHDRLAAAKGA